MDFGTFRPLITSFMMPPLALLGLALLGVLLAWHNQRRTGLLLTTLSLLSLGLLSCHGTAVWLAANTLPQVAPASVAQLQTRQVQAIVVLGGGLLPQAPEYGQAQPSDFTAARLRYGVWLARHSGLPLAFTGGTGWAADGAQAVSEASVAQRVALEDYGVTLRWVEAASRDTAGNARLLAPMLQRDGVQRIALVTDAWHMPRAMAAFERAGLSVTPAATGYVLAQQYALLEWLPSARGLLASQQVLREALGLAAQRFFDV